MRVEHERDVDPPGPCPDIREVGDPELVRAESREMPVDEISWSGLPRVRIDRTLPAPADHTGDAQFSHEAFDRAAGDIVPITTEPQPEFPGAEELSLLLPRRQDDRLPPFVRHPPG